MLHAISKRWSSWRFAIQDESGREVGEVELSSWRERGVIRCEGAEHHVFREGALRGAFLLDGVVPPLKAIKPSAFRNTFEIQHGAEQYVLSPRSAFRRDRLLFDDGVVRGSIVPESALSRNARIQLPEDLPLILKIFLTWLTLLQWKRESETAAVGGGG